MKRILSIIALAALLLCQNVSAQKKVYVEASDLTLVGKLFPNTPNPYHRVDTDIYHGFDDVEFKQVRMSSGIAVAFKTDSPKIYVQTIYGEKSKAGTTLATSLRGYDLYGLSDEGKWLWAGWCRPEKDGEDKTILSDADGNMRDYLLYLPLFSEVVSVKIGVPAGHKVEAIPNPFRYRIGVFGSSFTHGTSTSRPGMTYPAQLSRMTGLQMLSLGCSGHSKLQIYFANALADAQVDAFLFDAFSNPSAEEIAERLIPFIEKIQAKQPGVPLIFQRTIYRERRNFNLKTNNFEAEKIAMADRMMKEICEKYKDVYYITTTNAADPDHETSVDGTHPNDYGYTLWAQSIKDPLLEILAKYGIK